MGRRKDTGSRRSACPHCGHPLSARDLMPVFSWVFATGKCRYCKTPVSVFYPLTEVLTIGLCLLFFWVYGYTVHSVILVFLAPVLVAILMIDFQHLIIPNGLNAVIALAAVLAVVTADIGYNMPPVDSMESYAAKALAGGLVYFSLAFMLEVVFTRLLKKPALGGGDIKFFGAAGLWLGVNALPGFLMISGLSGIVLALIWRKITGEEHFPFGPALIVAFIVLLAGRVTIF